MKLRTKNPALVIVDVQKAFLDYDYWGGNRNNRSAELTCKSILAQWRALNLPVFHVRHSSTNPLSKLHKSNTGFDFHDSVLPIHHEPIITKQVNSAFIGTNLKEQLELLHIDTLVIVGMTTNHCISTTTRMAGNYGFDTYLISDATVTFDRVGVLGEKYDAETIHLTALANLKDEFATIWTSEFLLHKI